MVLLYIGLWLVQKFSPLSRPITTWSPALSRALGSSLAFTLRSHSFYKLFSFLLIGRWNFYWFWFCVTQSKTAQSQNIEINWQVQVSRELRQIKKTIKILLSYSTELKCVDINRCVFFFLAFPVTFEFIEVILALGDWRSLEGGYYALSSREF